ncbi:MAG: carboxypeptidase regulatory-like domain-containing protein, partial [bacterium]|nr:carboxypeptidase regulatory-like domain-containing protein [bacterium]
FPALEKEKPELYFNGIKNIEFSLLKYKDTVLDLLTESRFQTIEEGRKILLDKKYIEKEYTFQHQTGKGEAVRFPLAIKKPETETGAPAQSPIQQGLYAFKIDSLEVRNTCNDGEIRKYVDTLPLKLKLIHKKKIDFVVRAGYKRTFVWVFNNKTGKGIPNAEVYLLREASSPPAALDSTVWDKKAGCIIGRVTDEKGNPLNGVNVRQIRNVFYISGDEIKETTTNKDGLFLLV